MKQISVFLSVLLFSSVIVSGQQPTGEFVGKWKTDDGQVVTIRKNNQTFTGFDDKNRECLYNVHLEKDQWKGTVENHEKGKKADCEISTQDNKLKIVAHKGFLSKTFIWTKAQ